MKAFLLAMMAMVGISFVASLGLETVEMSADDVHTSNSVRLN